MQLVDLVKAVISKQHGWAVAEQFEDTFDKDEDFDSQNLSALRYILGTVTVLVDSGLLSEYAEEELSEYKNELEEYLPQAQ